MAKLFSIISPCYNGSKYLPNYFDSILNQTYSNIEVILVDDASTDDTYDLACSYIPKFIKKGYILRIEKLEVNSGQAAAINKALPLFSGEIMMWMDSDDILMSDAIEKKVNFLETHPKLDFCLNQGFVVNESDLSRVISTLERKEPKEKDDLFEDLIYERNVVFCPGTICVRKESLKRVIPSLHIYESREGQNWQLMLPLAYECKYGYLLEPLFKYVVHSDSHSHSKRSFEREIQRQNNFDILMKETINNIVSMSDNDKNKWNAKITIRTIKKKMNLTVIYRKKTEYKILRKELKEHKESIRFVDTYNFYIIKRIKKLIYKFLKINK